MIGLMELSPVIYLVFDVQRTWDAVIVESPYRIHLFNLSEADLSRWGEAFLPYIEPRNTSRSSLYLKVDDLDRCREILRLFNGHDTPDLQQRVVDQTLCDTMLDRFSCASNLLRLKSLIPPLPRDVDQDITIHHLDLLHMISVKVVHEGVARYVPINGSDSKIRASDVAYFTSKIPAARWDRLDYVLETFHMAPTVTLARPDDAREAR